PRAPLRTRSPGTPRAGRRRTVRRQTGSPPRSPPPPRRRPPRSPDAPHGLILELGQAGGETVDVGLRHLAAGPDLLDHLRRRLAQERLVAELGRGTGQFLARRGEVLG